ncbi:MAG: hypothetical protein LBS91_07715 [Clostridiales Family XIII bacterium]|jgi:cellulose biosynthesis protein BcsQ|nr:hypothetical protein [Clostridiales Family XIII bacterium]
MIDGAAADKRFDNVKAVSAFNKKNAAARFALVCEAYDYVLVDMPTGNDELKKFVFSIVGGVVVPLSPDASAVGGYLDALKMVNEAAEGNKGIVFVGGFLGRFNKARGNDVFVLGEAREKLDLIGVIPDRSEIAETITFETPISFYRPFSAKSKGRVAYEMLVDEIVKRLQ